MDSAILIKIIDAKKKAGKPIQMTVVGDSMLPALNHLDVITVLNLDQYQIGDILVYFYKHNEILIHRVLKESIGKYYCKGDNSFRLEDVEKSQVIGRAQSVKRGDRETEILNPGKEFIEKSHAIGQEFIKNRYDIVKTKQSEIYKDYEIFYLKRGMVP